MIIIPLSTGVKGVGVEMVTCVNYMFYEPGHKKVRSYWMRIVYLSDNAIYDRWPILGKNASSLNCNDT